MSYKLVGEDIRELRQIVVAQRRIGANSTPGQSYTTTARPSANVIQTASGVPIQ